MSTFGKATFLSLLIVALVLAAAGGVSATSGLASASAPDTPGSFQFTQVSAGGGHTCGVRADGAVACWGYNYYGQSSPPPVTYADFDGSGTVDVGDLADIAGRWDQTSSTSGWNSRYDLFPTNRIDMLDLMWATSQWGGGCS